MPRNKKGRSMIKNVQDAVVYDGRFMQTIVRSFDGTRGKPAEWEMIARKTFGRIVAIAAITPEYEIILERNFRIPPLDYIYELPAGLMDQKNESEADCAARELLEETGYITDPLDKIIRGVFNSGLSAEEIIYFCGLNARYVQAPAHEDEENIEVIKMPIDKLEDFLYDEANRVDPKTTCVLPYLRRKGLLK